MLSVYTYTGTSMCGGSYEYYYITKTDLYSSYEPYIIKPNITVTKYLYILIIFISTLPFYTTGFVWILELLRKINYI